MPHFDFFAIGDLVTEPFIKLTDAHVETNPTTGEVDLAMRFGDKIPYESAEICRAVGNSANAAVSAARLGLSSGLRSYVGDDQYGKECIEELEKNGVDTSEVVTQAGKNTNYHYVLWYESERTILVKHEDFTYTVPALADEPTWIYLSSLAANSLPYHQAWGEYLLAHPNVHLTFQPGTFQMSLGIEALKPLYERTTLYVVNKEEAERILKTGPDQEIPSLLHALSALGPAIVVITDGRDGAYAYESKTGKMLSVPMYPDDRAPFERTGAGDAFASSVTAALILGKPLEEALLWGPINSMSVVQNVGAQKGLLTREQLEAYLAKAPTSYRATPI